MVRGWTLPLLLLMLQGSCSTGATELVEARHPPVLPQTEATLSGLLLRHPDMQPRWDQEQVRGPSLQLFDWTVLVGGGLQERQQPRDSSCVRSCGESSLNVGNTWRVIWTQTPNQLETLRSRRNRRPPYLFRFSTPTL
jgi:hypothetical protein